MSYAILTWPDHRTSVGESMRVIFRVNWRQFPVDAEAMRNRIAGIVDHMTVHSVVYDGTQDGTAVMEATMRRTDRLAELLPAFVYLSGASGVRAVAEVTAVVILDGQETLPSSTTFLDDVIDTVRRGGETVAEEVGNIQDRFSEAAGGVGGALKSFATNPVVLVVAIGGAAYALSRLR